MNVGPGDKKIPFLERIIFKRGEWGDEDIADDKLCGFQILNGKLHKKCLIFGDI